MILGLTGTNGAGKAEVVKYLVSTKKFNHFSTSGFLANELERRGEEKTRTNLGALGNELRKKYGASYLADVGLRIAREGRFEHIVIESIRSTGEAEAIKGAGGYLIAVDADRGLRYERIMKRGLGRDKVDYDTFVTQEENEWYGAKGKHDMNIRSVIEMADYTILNDGSLEELHQAIDSILEKLEKEKAAP